MSFTRILSMAMAVVFGLTANAAVAQGGYGALSYFDWSIDGSGSSLESQGVRATGGLTLAVPDGGLRGLHQP